MATGAGGISMCSRWSCMPHITLFAAVKTSMSLSLSGHGTSRDMRSSGKARKGHGRSHMFMGSTCSTPCLTVRVPPPRNLITHVNYALVWTDGKNNLKMSWMYWILENMMLHVLFKKKGGLKATFVVLICASLSISHRVCQSNLEVHANCYFYLLSVTNPLQWVSLVWLLYTPLLKGNFPMFYVDVQLVLMVNVVNWSNTFLTLVNSYFLGQSIALSGKNERTRNFAAEEQYINLLPQLTTFTINTDWTSK